MTKQQELDRVRALAARLMPGWIEFSDGIFWVVPGEPQLRSFNPLEDLNHCAVLVRAFAAQPWDVQARFVLLMNEEARKSIRGVEPPIPVGVAKMLLPSATVCGCMAQALGIGVPNA